MIQIVLTVNTAAEAIAAYREIEAAGIGAAITAGGGRFRMTKEQAKIAASLPEGERAAYREKCRIEKMGNVPEVAGEELPEGEEY